MRPFPRLPRAALPAALVLAFALGPAGQAPLAQEKVPQVGTDRYRIRYADGTLTINDWCPVAKRGLGRSQTPIYVNGRPVGFC